MAHCFTQLSRKHGLSIWQFALKVLALTCAVQFFIRTVDAAGFDVGAEEPSVPSPPAIFHSPPGHPASVQTMAPLSQDSIFAGGYGWVFSPTPELQAVFQGQSGTRFEVLLPNCHDSCSIQTIIIEARCTSSLCPRMGTSCCCGDQCKTGSWHRQASMTAVATI